MNAPLTFAREMSRIALVSAAALILGVPTAGAAVPPGFTNEIIAGGFTNPVSAVFDWPTGRMFVVEKRGMIWIHQGGSTLPTPFIDLVSEVHDAGDKGLLGFALDPSFATNHFVYLLYGVDPIFGQPDEPEDSIIFGRLTRYTANGNVANLATRFVLLGDSAAVGLPSCAITHSIGSLKFGFDGSLFLSAGDGAHPEFPDGGQNLLPNDPLCDSTFGPAQNIGALRSQSLSSMGGKILRLNPANGQGLSTNPFWDGDPNSFASRIWVRGLRNPFRFNVRPGTPPPGTLYICDVGWHTWEELNVAHGGENFAWPCWEGVPVSQGYYYDEPTTAPTCQAISVPSVTPPLISYNHADPNPIGFVGNAATGNMFYTGTSYPPQYQGKLFFCDLGQHWIKMADVNASDQLLSIQGFAETLNFPVELSAHPENGDIVYVTIVEGRVRRIRYVSSNFPPNAFAGAVPTAGSPPLPVQFSSSGTNDPNGDSLTLTWNFGDGSAESNAANPIHIYTTVGTFQARLIARDPGGLADTAFVSIVTSNLPPTVDIVNPEHGFVFEPGTPILLSADASDPESGTNLAWSWNITLIHNEHVHPGWFNSTEVSPLFTPADHGGPGDRVSYRIAVTVTDPGGLAAGDSVVIVPPSLGGNAKPIPQFSASTYEGEAPLAVDFDASESIDPDLDLLTFEWRFGDGTTGTGEAISHIFGAFGNYPVTLVTQDPFLGADSAKCVIRVEPSGRLASWNFDEGSGNFIDDATANNRNGALNGSGFSWTTGVRGKAVDFLGTNAEMTTGQSFLSNRAAFTLAAWIRPHATSALIGVVGQNDAIEMGFDSPTMFDIWTPGGGEVLTPYSFPMNQWHHTASTGSGSQLRIYYDGAQAASGNFPTGNYGSSGYSVKVGGGVYDPTGGYLNGTVDDVRIYGRALSPAEIAFLAAVPPANSAPVVNAGPDLVGGVGFAITLSATVSDDGYPAPPGCATGAWSQTSGPGTASIFNPNRKWTQATFPVAGDYVLRFAANDGEATTYDETTVTVGVPTTNGETGTGITEGIHRLAPNPFRGETLIEYAVTRDGARVALSIHDVAGRRVATLVEANPAAGLHRSTWPGRDSSGHAAAAGIYFAVLDVEGRRYTKKIVMLR